MEGKIRTNGKIKERNEGKERREWQVLGGGREESERDEEDDREGRKGLGGIRAEEKLKLRTNGERR